MQEQLTAVRTIAEPLRLRLNVPPMKQHLQQLRQLEQLPQPLHTAYLQLRAAQEAFGLPAEISISGVHLQLICLKHRQGLDMSCRIASLWPWTPASHSGRDCDSLNVGCDC